MILRSDLHSGKPAGAGGREGTAAPATRAASAALDGLAAGLLIYMGAWVALVIVESTFVFYVGQKSEVPIPPPGDIRLRAPVLSLCVAGSLWVAWSRLRRYAVDARLPVWSLGLLLVTGGTVVISDQSSQSAFVQCTSALTDATARERRDACRERGEVPTRGLAVDVDRLVAAGDHACAWLEDRPWGEPADAGGRTVTTLAMSYRTDLKESGDMLTESEALSAQVAVAAWYELCPFQKLVHRGDGAGD